MSKSSQAKPRLVLGCHILILLKQPCSISHLFENCEDKSFRVSSTVRVYFQREKGENYRLKLDAKQDGRQGNQQNNNSHGSEVKYFTHRNTVRFQFLSP